MFKISDQAWEESHIHRILIIKTKLNTIKEQIKMYDYKVI